LAGALDLFSPAAQSWFHQAFGKPTDVQEQGWVEIAGGHHSLLCAPTGSGKTLAAFFWCLDRLQTDPPIRELERCRVLYVSPLKALAVDVDRNLRGPLAGLTVEASRMGLEPQAIRVGVRTGDTPSEDRRQMPRHPPDILITTPESLFLLLTSAARTILEPVRWVIVDEIHTMAGSKRGAHLAVSLERLCARTHAQPQRIGLSATQRPLEEVARYLGGRDRDVHIVDAGYRKTLDLSIELPAPEDLNELGPDSELRSGPAAALGAGAPAPAGRPVRHIGITTEIARGRPWAAATDQPNGGSATQGPESVTSSQDQSVSSASLWPAIYVRVLELIRAHRSTIVFVNSRRMAERLAAKLNELAGEELVRAHHGSIAREQRIIIEDLLKAGKLPALIATSSLELGIDMGAVDLVVQVGSPTSVSRGIQRVGRAGHSVGDPSTGTLFPTHRGDLLESAAVVERMLAGDIETTRVPHNPLDVLAQQVVAMCALDQWHISELRTLITNAYPFVDLGDRAFNATLDMLDGRYPSQEFSELRPRIVWDRMEGTVRGRQGAQRLAVTSGGTIPDRGLYTVNLLDDGKRVGELDEEMVYELRPGETFVLGATTWKAVEITQSQVLVVPAPGEPGKITFWHGDALGRPVEVGRAVGELTRELLNSSDDAAISRLESRAQCDPRSAQTLLAYVKDQQDATGAAPDDKTIVVERFRDQLGDWRVCVLTPFGARVHAPWVLAAQARLQERLGLEIQSICSDDGFALRLIDAESAPAAEELLIDPEDVREAVTAQLHGSALFASRFRENAARALLLPKLRPGSRTPLWLQRQKSADLLKVAARYPDFPILAETYRECLSDVFDLEALAGLMRRIRAREVRVVEVETAIPSPFSSSLVFDYIAQYMYDGDQPLAERRAQALTLDKELLNELLGDDDLRELLDPEVIGQTERELQCLDPDRWPRSPDEAHDLFRRVGDLSTVEAAARGVGEQWLAQLAAENRVIKIRAGGEERCIAAADAGMYRDALGVTLPLGLPEAFAQAVPNALDQLLTWWAQTHVPFVPSEPAGRWNLPAAIVTAGLAPQIARGDLIVGHFRRVGDEQEFCSADVLRIIRRRSLAALRHEIEPVEPVVLARFQPGWQGVGFQARGLDRLADVIAQLQGYPIPVSVLERDVLASRMSGYSPQLLDQLVGSGEVVWVGQGPLGLTDGRVSLYLRRDVRKLAAAPAAPFRPADRTIAEANVAGHPQNARIHEASASAQPHDAAGEHVAGHPQDVRNNESSASAQPRDAAGEHVAGHPQNARTREDSAGAQPHDAAEEHVAGHPQNARNYEASASAQPRDAAGEHVAGHPQNARIHEASASAQPHGRELHDRIRRRLGQGACFFADLLAAADWRDGEEVLDALWDLIWAGEVTNDMFAPLRFIGPSRRTSRRGMSRLGPPRSQGRWSLVADMLQPASSPTERLHGQCEQLLQRYGILTREHALAEGVAGGFVGIYPVLRSMEESGRIRRGYFVEGLGGAQFALAGAVDRLRTHRNDEAEIVLLAATDPASAYGVTVPWPEMGPPGTPRVGRPARAAGAYVVLDGGELRLFLERGGRSVLTHGEIEPGHVEQLAAVGARRGKLEIRTVDGIPVNETKLRSLLMGAGFALTHRGLVLYTERTHVGVSLRAG
jgi:ATP-dependent helicase Lhr and Lhr-like helicase